MVEALRKKPVGHGLGSRWGPTNFSFTNPSGRTTTIEWSQPATEISTTDLPWAKGGMVKVTGA
jgi:hypothetical protein